MSQLSSSSPLDSSSPPWYIKNWQGVAVLLTFIAVTALVIGILGSEKYSFNLGFKDLGQMDKIPSLITIGVGGCFGLAAIIYSVYRIAHPFRESQLDWLGTDRIILSPYASYGIPIYTDFDNLPTRRDLTKMHVSMVELIKGIDADLQETLKGIDIPSNFFAFPEGLRAATQAFKSDHSWIPPSQLNLKQWSQLTEKYGVLSNCSALKEVEIFFIGERHLNLEDRSIQQKLIKEWSQAQDTLFFEGNVEYDAIEKVAREQLGSLSEGRRCQYWDDQSGQEDWISYFAALGSLVQCIHNLDKGLAKGWSLERVDNWLKGIYETIEPQEIRTFITENTLKNITHLPLRAQLLYKAKMFIYAFRTDFMKYTYSSFLHRQRALTKAIGSHSGGRSFFIAGYRHFINQPKGEIGVEKTFADFLQGTSLKYAIIYPKNPE